MKNNKGFSFIEVLIASSLILMLAITIIPIGTQLQIEREILREKRIFANRLHDELQTLIWNGSKAPLPFSYEKIYSLKTATYHFEKADTMRKGCVSWTNAKKEKETVCLYGIPE